VANTIMRPLTRSRLRASYNPYRRTLRLWKGLAVLGAVFLFGLFMVHQYEPVESMRGWVHASAALLALGGTGWGLTVYMQHRAWRARTKDLDEGARQRVQGLLAAAIDACSQQGAGAVVEALRQGANPELPDIQGSSFLVRAVRSSALAAVQVLLESGFDVEKMIPADALLEAMNRNDEASVLGLLQAGVSPYDVTKEGIKPAARLWDDGSQVLVPRVWILLWGHLEWADQERVETWLETLPPGRRDHLKSLMDLSAP
jgi:hypothetical protein